MQPGPTDALRTFGPSTVNIRRHADSRGLIETELGNANLKPERSAELETGFETRLFGSRANIDFTYYDKKTRDALISLPIARVRAPSPTSLTVRYNLGSVRNTGYETSINAQLVDRPLFGWDVTLSGSHNSNKVLSLGVDRKREAEQDDRDRDGARLGGLLGERAVRPSVSYADANNDGVIQQTEVTVDTGVVYAAIRRPATRLGAERFRSSSTRASRQHAARLQGRLQPAQQYVVFICQQSPKACQERSGSRRCRSGVRRGTSPRTTGRS